VLLPETGMEGGLIVAERLRQAIEAYAFKPVEGETPLHCTMSIGVATWHGVGECEVEALLAAADTALYEAKHSGRNRVVVGEFGPVAAET
jgi:diguanylate cyclase (GGDEF)-like protein